MKIRECRIWAVHFSPYLAAPKGLVRGLGTAELDVILGEERGLGLAELLVDRGISSSLRRVI